MALIPVSDASVAAFDNKPLLPLLAQREAAIRFPRHVQYRDRQGRVQPVDWVVAIPGYHTPLAPSFMGSRNKQQRIQRELRNLKDRAITAWCIATVALLFCSGNCSTQLQARWPALAAPIPVLA